MSHHYATDWHQCMLCGCTRPDAELNAGEQHDVVLQLKSTVYGCRDQLLCARLKVGRAEHLANERRAAHLEVVGKAIVPRRRRAK